jgi:hypothetical protein
LRAKARDDVRKHRPSAEISQSFVATAEPARHAARKDDA